MSRIANDATPFAHRDAMFAFSQDALWDKPEEAEANVQWVKGYWQAMRRIHHEGRTSISWRTKVRTVCARAIGAITTVSYRSNAGTIRQTSWVNKHPAW